MNLSSMDKRKYNAGRMGMLVALAMAISIAITAVAKAKKKKRQRLASKPRLPPPLIFLA